MLYVNQCLCITWLVNVNYVIFRIIDSWLCFAILSWIFYEDQLSRRASWTCRPLLLRLHWRALLRGRLPRSSSAALAARAPSGSLPASSRARFPSRNLPGRRRNSRDFFEGYSGRRGKPPAHVSSCFRPSFQSYLFSDPARPPPDLRAWSHRYTNARLVAPAVVVIGGTRVWCSFQYRFDFENTEEFELKISNSTGVMKEFLQIML